MTQEFSTYMPDGAGVLRPAHCPIISRDFLEMYDDYLLKYCNASLWLPPGLFHLVS